MQQHTENQRPIKKLLSTTLGIIEFALDDDDEPFDARKEFEGFLDETLGEGFGDLVKHGVMGAGFSGRVSLDGLWVRNAGRELEGQDKWAFYAQQVAGPVLGGILPSFLGASKWIDKGQPSRAVESVTPNFLFSHPQCNDLSSCEFLAAKPISYCGWYILPSGF